MEPGLKGGDVGGGVVFDAPGRQVIHRVIEVRTGRNGEPLIVTQGDNVPVPDFPILASQVNGKLVGEVPILGSLSRMLDAESGVYRSVVLTLAVTTVALWGFTTSASRRRQTLAADDPTTNSNPEEPEEPQA